MTRYSIHGHQLTGTVFETSCGDCGMPTISADEFHPYEACKVYLRTHDSRAVERVIEPLFRVYLADRREPANGQARPE